MTPRRRWLQFSLRTMMVLMVVFGAGFGWLGMMVKRARAQRDAAKAIEELGGHVQWNPPSSGMVRNVMDSVGTLLGENLSGDVVAIGNWRATDAGLLHLRGLTQLRILLLNDTQVTDTGLEQVGGLTQLNLLDLSQTRVTDAGLVHLRGLTQLDVLNLSNTQVTDTGLEHLGRLPRLDLLDLSKTPVTDAGLMHFRGLTGLRMLFLDNTQVTDEGVAELKKALPNCQILQ